MRGARYPNPIKNPKTPPYRITKRKNLLQKESSKVETTIPTIAIVDVIRFEKDSFLKLLQKIPKSVKTIARVLMMARSLTARWVYPE